MNVLISQVLSLIYSASGVLRSTAINKYPARRILSRVFQNCIAPTTGRIVPCQQKKKTLCIYFPENGPIASDNPLNLFCIINIIILFMI